MTTTDNHGETPPRLEVLSTCSRAASALYSNRRALLRLGAIPGVVWVALQAIRWQVSRLTAAQPTWAPVAVAASLLIWLATIVVWTLFAVAWHRQILLGAAAPGPAWSSRHTHFQLALFGLAFVGLLLALPALLLTAQFMGPGRSGKLLYYLALLPSLYVVTRLSLILPAIAIDRGRQVNAWLTSRANGWRLLAVTALPALLGGLLLSTLTGPQPTWPVWSVRTVLMAVLGAYGATTLSLSFQQLDHPDLD